MVIPTYNEAENLPRLVSALLALPLDLGVLVVDDNSPDGTGTMADELASAHPGRLQVMHRSGKLGLSSAYLQAFEALLAEPVEAIGQMDADFSHDPQALPAMVERLESCDMVLGSRYTPGGQTDVNWPAWRKALSAWANFYVRTILGIPIRDATTGFRLWRRSALEKLPRERIKSSGYIFLVEMAFLAYRTGNGIGEVPIYFADRRWGKSKMTLRIQLEAAFRVWQLLWEYRDLAPRSGAR